MLQAIRVTTGKKRKRSKSVAFQPVWSPNIKTSFESAAVNTFLLLFDFKLKLYLGANCASNIFI